MRTIVLDTNCLLAILPSVSPYHNVWTGILKGDICLCVSTDILSEYEEILSLKTLPEIADSVINTLLKLPSLRRVSPSFFYNLITDDPDDNKFVDCAIASNAKYIVSQDHHFDILKRIPFPKVDVISIDSFLTEIE